MDGWPKDQRRQQDLNREVRFLLLDEFPDGLLGLGLTDTVAVVWMLGFDGIVDGEGQPLRGVHHARGDVAAVGHGVDGAGDRDGFYVFAVFEGGFEELFVARDIH